MFNDPYMAHGLMRVVKGPFQGESGITAGSAISPDLTWEKSEQYNIGLDLDMLNYRLKVKLDYYYKLTSSLIYSVPLPETILLVNKAYGKCNGSIERGNRVRIRSRYFCEKAL